jgi:hypothetical protein
MDDNGQDCSTWTNSIRIIGKWASLHNPMSFGNESFGGA